MRSDTRNNVVEESNFGTGIITSELTTCRKSSRTSCQRELELTDSSSVSLFVLLCTSNMFFLCLRYIEYLVEFIYGRSVTIRALGQTDKVAIAAERFGRVIGGSASPVAKTRTSGDWRAMRGRDCECTASTMPFR